VKAQVNAGRRRELYYFRDQQGLEVDFVVPGRSGSVRLVEAKAGRTVTPAMTASMQRLADAHHRLDFRRKVEMFLVHRPARQPTASRAVAPGVKAVAWQEFVAGVLP
jgi:predicted AAA+ superfamily ATPase